MTFHPRIAIVTASDSGIGRATAVPLAASGLAEKKSLTCPSQGRLVRGVLLHGRLAQAGICLRFRG